MLIPPGEKIVETKKCRLSGRDFFVTDKDLEFYDKISPIFGGKKYLIPSPTLFPEERQKRRLCFRNERYLYSGKCAISKRDIVTIYAQNKKYNILSTDEYKKWDNTKFGVAFDNTKTFFSQFQLLYGNTYKHALHQNGTNENSDFNEYVWYLHDCYLIFDSGKCEKCCFGHSGTYSKDSFDFVDLCESDNCYEVVNITRSSHIFYSKNCHNSSFLFACNDCVGCSNCIGCVNLRNKQNYIFNKPVNSEQYKKAWEDIFSGNQSIFKKVLYESIKIQKEGVHKNFIITNSNNAIGDYIISSNNVFMSHQVFDAENIKYCDIIVSAWKDLMDISSYWEQMSYCLEMQASWGAKGKIAIANCAFSSYIFYWWNSVFYSIDCSENAQNIFGCCDLIKGKNCILNRPYSTQEYESLCWCIIDHMRSTGEWWEFFPHELSPFGYNETVAQEYFPLTESEVKSRGWNWYNAPEKTFEGSNDLAPLPISDYDERTVWFEAAQKNIDTLLSWVVKCEVTGKPFKIIKQELAFYIEHHLPIPTKHPDQRHKERMALRNPRELHERHCAECGRDIVTTYAPDRPEKVVCEECYRKIVY